MKIAIVHDYIKEYGGAERVLEELHELFPEAPIFTSIFAPEFLGPHGASFVKMNVRASFLNLIPYREKLISVFRLLSPFAFWSFVLDDFDVIIVSQTGAYFPNLTQKGPKTKLICYTHTPPRYLYGYMTAREWKKDHLMNFFGTITNHFLRLLDFKASENVDYFIANSEEIKARIQKFYRKDAVVINPPVDIPESPTKVKKQNYYLTGGRLARAKGTDIIIKAFNENGKKLKIFGKGFAGFDEELRKIAKSNIEFVGEVTDDARSRLMTEAKAYVFASFDEDFGITPVEAQAVGTPVIAYKSGGVKETVVDGKTGIFFDENTPESLNSAIKKFEASKFSSEVCRHQAQKFSSEIFDKKIKEFVTKIAK